MNLRAAVSAVVTVWLPVSDVQRRNTAEPRRSRLIDNGDNNGANRQISYSNGQAGPS